MKPRRIRIERAPVAVTSSGALVLNLGFVKEGNLDQLVTFAREVGGRVFVGLVVEGKHRTTLVRDVDDAAFDMAVRLGADVVKGKRAGTRKKASTTR
jgi:predicted lactoylglutathione lyase